jgi:hypothetical protein
MNKIKRILSAVDGLRLNITDKADNNVRFEPQYVTGSIQDHVIALMLESETVYLDSDNLKVLRDWLINLELGE